MESDLVVYPFKRITIFSLLATLKGSPEATCTAFETVGVFRTTRCTTLFNFNAIIAREKYFVESVYPF